jgi:N-methylhydantoinase A
MSMDWRAGTDIGGTFTDIAYIDDDGFLFTEKVPSTPENYGAGVVSGLTDLAVKQRLEMAALSEMAHGCTVATNAILEAKGAKTALLTTEGFRDVLELRRIRVPRLYDPLYVKPEPLAPRNLRFEVRERLDAEGAVVEPLDEAGVRAAAEAIKRAGAEAVAVCFLHSYRNPAHERRAGEILREMLPDAFVTLSVDILPQIREYERTSTTVVNAYVGPPVGRYVAGMADALAQAGSDADIMIMQSSGGTVGKDSVIEKPAQIIECGPAAGVVGAAYLCEKLGIDSAITFDMGGTTAKGSLIDNGELIFAENYEVGASMSTAGTIAGGAGYALSLPVIDISEVGAGGGSIVHLDKAGAIKIGPESAGAAPGPACYGMGGTAPTVTDANVVIGYLNPGSLAGGTVPIDAGLSRVAIERVVADPLGLDLMRAAYGVHEVASATMVRAIKAVTTYRGRDPRDFAMIAFGGNGGVHGAGMARSLQVRRVVVPPAAGVFSAVGLLLAKRSVTVLGALSATLGALDAGQIDPLRERLEAEAARLLNLAPERAEFGYLLDMRYVGQAFELSIPFDLAAVSAATAPALRRAFDDEHERRFGHKFDAENEVEIVAVRVAATDSGSQAPARVRFDAAARPPASRDVYFGDAFGVLPTPVIGRGDLDATPRRGPFIVEEYEGTTVVPPDAQAFRDGLDNIVIDLDTERRGPS